MLIDALIITNAYLLASFFIFYSSPTPSGYYREMFLFIPIAILIHCALNYRFGSYHSVGRYVGLHQAVKMAQATLLATAALFLIGPLILSVAPLHALLMVPLGGLIVFVICGGIRFYPRIFYERSLREVTSSDANLLVVGAGNAGENIIRNLQREPASELKAVALVDDNPNMRGLEIHGVPIHGPADRIPDLVARKNIDEILIAIPSATTDQFQRIWRICAGCEVPVKTVDSVQRTHLGQVGLREIREIRVEDVLGRQPVRTDFFQIRDFIQGKTVVVTGAGGSIGSELVMQISRQSPESIVLIDQDETSLYNLHERLKHHHFHDYEMFVADVKSEAKMDSIFGITRPDVVFHSAAYKHVPLMEMHPDEGVLNNVLGTLNVARVAGEHGVDSFVNISTDKAVEPVNVMGATKRLSERIVAELEVMYPETLYCSVRFGNVLGSRGSVIPIFRQQIIEGGPVTVTDPRMTRYFMTIAEAVDLVLQAAAFREGDSIYVLDMGKPVQIVDLARQMIEFIEPDSDIEIVCTGLRPGEKLHESLFEPSELQEPSAHLKINRISPFAPGEQRVSAGLDLLPELFDEARANNHAAIRSMLMGLIPTYRPLKISNRGPVTELTTESRMSAGSAARSGMTMAGSLSYKWSNEDESAEAGDRTEMAEQRKVINIRSRNQ